MSDTITCAADALPRLRHKRTGEPLPEKRLDPSTNLGRNSRLIYYADEFVGLKFHDTVVAHFTSEGVQIDVRPNATDAPFKPEGWFTMATWACIDRFTPAKNFTERGLRYIDGHLYRHGAFVKPNGDYTNPLEPAMEDAIKRILHGYPTKFRRYATKVVRAFDNLEDNEDCRTCNEPANVLGYEDGCAHYLRHIENGEVVIPGFLHREFNSERHANLWGDALLAHMTNLFTSRLKDTLIRTAIKLVDHEFPYPQLQRRKR